MVICSDGSLTICQAETKDETGQCWSIGNNVDGSREEEGPVAKRTESTQKGVPRCTNNR